MIYRRRIFTESEIARARKMRLAGSTWAELGAAFNCDYATVRRVIDPGYSEHRALQISEAKAGRGNAANLRISVPEIVLQDRDRRNAAARTITASLCGDPAPGQSALDRLRGRSA